MEEELQITQERIKEAVSKAGTHAKSQRKRIKYLDHSDLNIVTGKHDDEKLVVINVEEVLQKSTKCLEKLKDISRPNKKQQADLNRVSKRLFYSLYCN